VVLFVPSPQCCLLLLSIITAAVAGHPLPASTSLVYRLHCDPFTSICLPGAISPPPGVSPKRRPNYAILGVPARANLNGYPYQGSNAQFLLYEVQWLKAKKVEQSEEIAS